jgi:hypothetical protein
MNKKLLTVFLGNNSLDNDYTFYEDGKVIHEYDQSAYKLNQKSEFQINQLDKNIIDRITEKITKEEKILLLELIEKYK